MEIVTDEKIKRKVLRSELKEYGFKLDSLVRCIHCGRRFHGFEMRVFEEEGNHLVCCKFPNCNGSIIDIVADDDEGFATIFDK